MISRISKNFFNRDSFEESSDFFNEKYLDFFNRDNSILNQMPRGGKK